MTLAPTATSVPERAGRQLVELACRAPSVDNTQPWAWRLRPDGMNLYADHHRRPSVADPAGRGLVISCGAALHHVQVAARAMGWASDVRRFPDAGAPALLAEVRLSPTGPPRSAAGELAALRDRRTDRRRFTSWPVPHERLAALTAVARAHGVGAVALTDVGERFRVELLVSRAQQLQDREIGATADDGRDVEGSDGLVVLYAEDDSREAWLRAGEGLSALWLDAVGTGLSVVPLSHVLAIEETRAALRHVVLGGLAVPLLLVRVGWQAISRSQLVPTTRRPLDQVLLP